MATVFEPNTKLGKPTAGDVHWGRDVWNPNADVLEGVQAIAGLMVSLHEVPSTTLTVRIAPGWYINSDGGPAFYAGSSSTSIAASSTVVLYIDFLGVLQQGAGYPSGFAYHPLATVVTGSSTVTSIADGRLPGSRALLTLANAVNDAAAATAGVPIGGIYRNGSIMMNRVT